MNTGGDKLVTNAGSGSAIPSKSGRSRRRKKRGHECVVKFGSATVPVYRMDSGGRQRFTIAYYREGKRLRQVFSSLDDAKKEALLVAQRIQSGMQHMTDLKPHDREAYLTARKMTDEAGMPLVAVVEDYLRARKIAGSESLAAMASEYSKHFGNLTRRATVPEVVAQLIASKTQDGSSTRHIAQIRSVLNRFAAAHSGEILDVTSSDIDAWLRSLNVAPSSRNSMLIYVNLLLSHATGGSSFSLPKAARQFFECRSAPFLLAPALNVFQIDSH